MQTQTRKFPTTENLDRLRSICVSPTRSVRVMYSGIIGDSNKFDVINIVLSDKVQVTIHDFLLERVQEEINKIGNFTISSITASKHGYNKHNLWIEFTRRLENYNGS